MLRINTKLKVMLLVASVGILSWLLFAVTSISAAGPHAGTFTGTTDACAGCHRTHTGTTEGLLMTADQYAMCTSCHGGTGANTDVVHGVYLGTTQGQLNNGLKGGGFETALMNTGLSTSFNPAGTPMSVTSRHTVGTSAATVWGSGAIGSGVGATVALKCTNCHNPHGNANYRILRPQPTALSDWESMPPIALNSGISDNYTVGYYAPGSVVNGSTSFNNTYTPYNLTTPANPNYSAVPLWRNWLAQTYVASNRNYNTINPNTGNWYTDSVLMNMADWCGQCHDRIERESRTNPNTDPIYTYGHRTDFAHSGNTTSASSSRTRNCLMCHVAHGTSATMSGPAASIEYPNHASPAWQGTEIKSFLLAADNRGSCRQCHATSVNAN